jgi:hypothetical protein
MGFVSGMHVAVFQGTEALQDLPAGATLTPSFVFPDTLRPDEVVVLYWDEALKNGLGDWRELIHSSSAGRIESTVRLTGTFVLVTR